MTTPSTTIFPVASLPTCITACGSLYDVNGKCVPPATTLSVAGEWDSCFCSDSRLTPWMTTTTDLCNGNCASTDLASIESWYTSFCNSVSGVAATATASSGASAVPAASGSGGGGTWVQTHTNWIVFLVIMVVGIVGIWVGSWAWRKHYLAKRDRRYALGKNLAHETQSGNVVPNNTSDGTVHVPQPGMFMPAPISAAGIYSEKPRAPPPQKKKWIAKERT